MTAQTIRNGAAAVSGKVVGCMRLMSSGLSAGCIHKHHAGCSTRPDASLADVLQYPEYLRHQNSWLLLGPGLTWQGKSDRIE